MSLVVTNFLSCVWLAYSGNKFFRVGPEKFVPGGTNFRGVKIKRDMLTISLHTMHKLSISEVSKSSTSAAIRSRNNGLLELVLPAGGSLPLSRAPLSLAQLMFSADRLQTVRIFPETGRDRTWGSGTGPGDLGPELKQKRVRGRIRSHVGCGSWQRRHTVLPCKISTQRKTSPE